MSGVQLSLLPKTTIDMGNTAVASQAGVEVYFAQNVNVVAFREGFMLIRVHAKTMPASTEVQFAGYNSAPTQEDPAVVFRNTSVNLVTGFKLSATGSAPALITASLSPSAFGGSLDFSYKPIYASPNAGFIVTLSIDLVLKF